MTYPQKGECCLTLSQATAPLMPDSSGQSIFVMRQTFQSFDLLNI
jgi:hypothetical protein